MKSFSCGVFWAAAFFLAVATDLRAVNIVTTESTTTNTVGTPVTATNWSTGWGSGGYDGLDYVGVVNGTATGGGSADGYYSSGVYLGNGWVITAAHVGSGEFTLGGYTYSIVAGSTTTVQSGVDLLMFQIDTSSSTLPTTSLTLSQTSPTYGAQVVMVGCAGQVESWGVNTVSRFQVSTHPPIYSTTSNVSVSATSSTGVETTYTSNDFATIYSSTNSAQVVEGDSGGGAFIYNSTTSTWELAGILEAKNANGDTYMVNLAAYNSQITAIMASAVPEPTTYAMMAMGVGTILLAARKQRRNSR